MSTLEALFILFCFRGVVVENLRNVSVNPQVNSTGLHINVTNVSVIPEMSTAGSNSSVSSEENANSSNFNPQLNNTTSYNATNTPLTSQGVDNTASDKSFDTVFPTLNDTLFKKNLPFFSEDFITQLEIWKKILINASRRCMKLTFSGTDIEKNLGIDFPVFRAKVDDEDAFLSFDTIHPVLVRGKGGHFLFSIAYLSILELWPLLVLCFSCAALSGMIMWLLVSTE